MERQRIEGWGENDVERLAADLSRKFPGVAGFSRTNIGLMRTFYLAWPEEILSRLVTESGDSILPQPVAELPWGHNIILLDKLKDPAVRLWYAQQARANGWARSTLEHWIESDLQASGRPGIKRRARANARAAVGLEGTRHDDDKQ